MSTITVYLLLSLCVLCTINGQGQSCLDGFPSVTDNTCTSSSCPFQGLSIQQLRLFPSMRITCNGMLVGLSVAGETGNRNKDSPILQIWRLTGPMSNDYMRISEYTFPIGCTQLPNNVWQCTVSPSIDVEVGDIIGINLPPTSNGQSAFRIYFTSPSSFTSYILDSTSASTFPVPGSTTASAQPVLTLDIQEQVTETTTTEPTKTQAPTPEPTTQASTPGLTTQASTPGLTTQAPTTEPTTTQAPTTEPTTTQAPTPEPTTQASTPGLTTQAPTTEPAPTPEPTTQASTPEPTTTQAPTTEPTTQASTPGLTTQAPTPEPTTQAPTPEPTTQTSTSVPTTQAPTPEPTTQTSTSVPTTQISTSVPTTQAPTPEPTTQAPTPEPTPVPTTQTPTPELTTTQPTPPEDQTTAAGAGQSGRGTEIAGPLVGGVVGVLLLVLIVVIVVIFLLWNRKRSRYNMNKERRRGTTYIENMTYDDVCLNTANVKSGSVFLPMDNVNYDCPDMIMENCGDYDDINDNVPVGDYETTIDPNDYCSTPVPPLSGYEDPMAGLEYEAPVSTLGKGMSPPGEWGLVVPSQEHRSKASTQNGVSGKDLYAAIKTSQYSYAGPAPKFFEECETYWAPSSQANELYEQLATRKYREILREQIQITEFLGSGAFGTVNKGLWQSPGGAMEVAIKTNQSKDEEDKVKFLQEAAIMGQFRHPNVVKLYGVVTVGEPVMIVLDLLSNGDLRNFLIKMQPDRPGEMVPSNTPKLLLKFCQQISSGMDYLARKAFVHRDLAARNILVSEDKVCKISDFGMSRDLMDESYYVSQGGKIPVKWTAPEALHYKKYSVASDVWSFGCVMYEIWSLGHKPFEAFSNVETIKMVDKGVRLAPPPGCPRELYKLMVECWHSETSRRPSFHQLVEMLSQADFELLLWNKTDSGVGPQVTVVGASLEAAKNLYTDLQNAYIKQPNKD